MGTRSKTATKSKAVCVVCGKRATAESTLKLPACEAHLEMPTQKQSCPECDNGMKIKEGKNGAFWRCEDFPNCFGTRSLANPDEEQNLL